MWLGFVGVGLGVVLFKAGQSNWFAMYSSIEDNVFQQLLSNSLQ